MSDAADTTAEETTVPSPSSATEDDRQARHRRWWAWGVALTALGLIAAGLTYVVLTSRAADQVVIRWLDSEPRCTGAQVRPARRADAFGDVVPARIVAAPGMRCTVRIEVVNNSSRDVVLQHASARFNGPATGAVVRLDPRYHPQDAETVPQGWSDLDGYVPLELPVLPHEADHFTLHLSFKARGACFGDGGGVGRMTTDPWPDVEFSVWGRSFTRGAGHPLSIEMRHRVMGCGTD